MKQVNIHEAKTRFSQLVAEVEAGEEIVVARAGKPVVRLVKEPEEPKVYRTLGGWEGWGDWDQAAWDAADAEILADFEASIDSPLFPEDPDEPDAGQQRSGLDVEERPAARPDEGSTPRRT